MSNRRSGGFFERDSRGRAKIIITERRSSSQGKSTRELLNEAEEREQELISQVSSLQTRLSFAERDVWQIRQQYQTLANQHSQCRNQQGQLEVHRGEVHRLDELLIEEENKNDKLSRKVEKLEEKIRLLKRGIVEDYRGRYDQAMRDIDMLSQRLGEKTDELRVADVRLAEKNRIILELRDHLNVRSYRR